MKLVFRMVCYLPGTRYIAQQGEVESISVDIQSVLTALTLETSLVMGAKFIGCT